MISWTDQEPAVTVVVPSAATARYTMFEIAFEQLRAPAGSFALRSVSPAIARNCNEGIRRTRTDYYWFLDDDQDFQPQTLLALLQHHLPFVVPFVVAKAPPWYPILFKQRVEKPGRPGRYGYLPYTLAELAGKSGLLEVLACGRSGMLIRRDALEAVGEPWFRMGQLDPEDPAEDWDLCERLRAHGVCVLVDLDVPLGHIDPCAAWPQRNPDGTWAVRLAWGNEGWISVTPTQPGATP